MVADRLDARFQKRLVIVFCLLGVGFLAVILRLVLLMVIQHQDLARKADRQHQKTVQIEPRRGTIYDRNGRELAVSLETDSLYAVPSAVDDPKALAARLSPALGLPASALKRKLDSGRSFEWLLRKMDPARVAQVKALGLDSQTIGFLTESRRFYPRRNLASHALGFAGMDNRGLEGIELQYDPYLSGESGWILLERDALGKPLFSEKLHYRAPSPGHDLALTLDEVIQYLTEKEMDRVMAETQAKDATAIVMDPRTGAILALATRPEFNPNAASKYQPARWKNRPVTDLYEPGSTFKVFLAAAALEAGAVRPWDRFDCGAGRIEVGGKAIHDVHRHGVLTFHEILMKSSNVGAVQIAQRLGKERFHQAIRDFGFGQKSGVDLPGEATGIVRDPKAWSAMSIGALAIGQEIGVTPLQLLTAFSALANGGLLVKPYLVSEIRSADGRLLRGTRPEVVRRVVSEETARQMLAMLQSVTEEGGTGKRAAIAGFAVAGKTGTAQKIDPRTGLYAHDRFVSSFVGVAPAEDPVIAVIIVVNEPRGVAWGGSVAAPAFRAIAEQSLAYLRIPSRDDRHPLRMARR